MVSAVLAIGELKYAVYRFCTRMRFRDKVLRPFILLLVLISVL